MKKINKKKLAMFVVSILAIALVSAVLVGYLSNTVQSDFTVSSPLVMTGDVLVNEAIYGGEKIEYKVTTKNNANVEVWSFAMTEVTAPYGTTFSGDEFTSIIFKDNSYPEGIEVSDYMMYVKEDGTLGNFADIGDENTRVAHILFDNGSPDFEAKGYAIASGSEFYNDISITTSPALTPGNYIIKSCQLFDKTADCPTA